VGWRRPIGAAVLVTLVAVVVVAALRVVGSPGEARLQRLDEQRIADLREISAAVMDYYDRQGKRLPSSLEVIASTPNQTVTTRDPETRAAYEYRVVAPNAYDVCAVFARGSTSDADRNNPFWAHAAGAHCFRVTVD
jgi:hypothetical protein